MAIVYNLILIYYIYINNTTMSSFTEIINNYVKNYKKITLNEFIEEIKNKLYPGKNMTFMEYFMELADEDNDGKFIVPHQKLIEYGVLTCIDDSSKVKNKLNVLGLISNEHYIVADIGDKVNNVGTKPRKQYTLTPEAFKLCLLRAKKSNKEGAVDPKIYAEYYMFIEKCILYYNKYEKQLAEAFSKIKDDNIKRLEIKIDKQSEEIKQLLNYGKSTTNTLTEVKNELINTKDELEDTNDKLDKTNTKLDKVIETLDDRSIKTKAMQYFIVYGTKVNNQIIFLYFGGQKHMKKVKRDNEELGNYVIINETYNPNPLSLKSRLGDRFKNYTIQLIEKVKTDYKNKLITNKEKIKQRNNILNNPPIKFNKTSITINTEYIINMNVILDIINEEHNRRFDINGNEIFS